MKQFLKFPIFNVLLLALYTNTLIGKLKGISHIYASNAVNPDSYFHMGYNWGYRSGYMASIAVWIIGIIMISMKPVKGEPTFSFIKR